MSKRLIVILALAFVVGITFAAYAEVQNVKVSGDLTVTGVARNNLDLAKEANDRTALVTTATSDRSNSIFSIARVRVDADLTDNVATTVRLLNERTWNGEGATMTEANRNIGAPNLGTTVGDNDENDIDLDLAFVSLKEFLYSPLALKVGRQELMFGNGLVVGDPDTNVYSERTNLAQGDLSARKAFDAIRATLDYNPLVVDLVYAKVQEGQTNLNDDVTLLGANAAYELDSNTTLEGFFFSKVKGNGAAAVSNVDSGNATSFDVASQDNVTDATDKVHTIGARLVNKSVKNLALDGQLAYQFGTYNPKFDPNARWISAAEKRDSADRSAWAAQIAGTYDLKDVSAISKYSPTLTGAYTYLSGADRDARGSETYEGWDPMFEDQTCGHLMNAIFANTNKHQGALSAKAKLTDDVSANLDYTMAWFAKRYPDGRAAVLSGVGSTNAGVTATQFTMDSGTKFIGQEIDLNLTYDYTEDVQFSLLGGIFMPGASINERTEGGAIIAERAKAVELLGSMKVTF